MCIHLTVELNSNEEHRTFLPIPVQKRGETQYGLN